MRPDRRPRDAEGRGGVVGVEDRQPVGDHRAAADGDQVRVLVPHLRTEVGAGLLDVREVVADGPQVVDDVRAVAAQPLEELEVGQPGDGPVRRVVRAVQRIDLVGPDHQVQQPGDQRHGHGSDDDHGGEEREGEAHGLGVEADRGHVGHVRVEQCLETGCQVEQQESATDRQRHVHQQQLEKTGETVGGPSDGGAAGPGDPYVVHVRGLGGRAVPAQARRHRLALEQRGRVAELGPVTHRGADVEDGLLADVHVPAEGDRTGPDAAGDDPVAEEVGVLADDRARADREQVGADRKGRREDGDAPADPRAERPQVEHVERVPGEQAHRVGVEQRPDRPEAQIGEPPDRELGPLPPADQHPLGHHRQHAHPHEGGAAEDDRPQIDVDGPRTGVDPLVALDRDEPGEEAVRGEDQQLRGPAQDIPRGAAGRRGLGRRRDGRLGRGVGERRRQTPDRRTAVHVLHRHRRQVVPLPDPGAEVRHDQGVGAQIVEEVAVERDMVPLHDTREHLGEDLLGAASGAGRVPGRVLCRVLGRIGRRHGRQLDRFSPHLSPCG